MCDDVAPSSKGPRFFSPWEQAASLGLPSTVKLPGSLEMAWHVLGNAISVAHALLQLSRLHLILGEGSPFSQTTSALPTLCRMMQRKGIHLSGMKQVWVEGRRILVDARVENHVPEVPGEISQVVLNLTFLKSPYHRSMMMGWKIPMFLMSPP